MKIQEVVDRYLAKALELFQIDNRVSFGGCRGYYEFADGVLFDHWFMVGFELTDSELEVGSFNPVEESIRLLIKDLPLGCELVFSSLPEQRRIGAYVGCLTAPDGRNLRLTASYNGLSNHPHKFIFDVLFGVKGIL